MANVEQELLAFKNAKKGEDVRDALCSAIRKINTVNEEGVEEIETKSEQMVEIVDSQIQIDEEPTQYTKLKLETTGSTINVVTKEELDEYIGDSEVVKEAVSDWLDDHPEATTTVQDASLTESKFTDTLKLKTIKDYVTPEMFGAKGDGVTDDTSAFSQALNSGIPVLISPKTYLIEQPINNPATFTMYGIGTNANITGKAPIIKTNDKIFANNISYSEIKNIVFVAPATNTITAFPQIVLSTTIEGCLFYKYNKIFVEVKTTTKILNNYFYNVQSDFCASIVDSDVCGNYINAPKVTNPQTTLISYGAVNSKFTNNFIDYMYKVFACNSASNISDVIIANNVFDFCYCMFFNYAKRVTMTGNVISNMKKDSTKWDVSGNSDMENKQWCIYRRTVQASQFSDNAFVGNTFYNLDTYMVCEVAGRPTFNLLIDENVDASKFDFKTIKSGTAGDMTNIQIRPMLKRTVDSLPNPSITSSSLCVTFNHDEVIYSGNLYMNINGAWKQITS